MKDNKKNDKENKDQHTESTDKRKESKTDITNSLEQDAIGDKGVNNYTPQNRTDNEQNREQNK
jgi:hypothetical protein